MPLEVFREHVVVGQKIFSHGDDVSMYVTSVYSFDSNFAASF